MVVSRRLLAAAGGLGSFAPPPTILTAFDLTTGDGEGGWCWFTDPRAVSYNGTTYWGYVNYGGDVTARSTVNATKVTNTLVPGNRLSAAMEIDDHVHPSVIVRNSDRRLLYFYSKHLGSTPYLRISTNPEDISAFGAEASLDASIGGTLYTYMNPCQLSGESDAIYLFFRDHVDGGMSAPDWCYSKSTNGGAAWSAEVDFIETTYARISDNGTDRIDIIASEHPNDTDRHEHSIWHGYCTGGNFYQTDGTLIGAMNAGPYATSAMTKVYDGATIYGWVWDVALDGTGKPACTYVTFPDSGDHSIHKYNYARWTGAAWDAHEIVDGGGPIDATPVEIEYSGGVVLDHADPSIVYASIGLGGDRWDVYRYQTGDGGSSWSSAALTSSGKNCRPVAVRNSDPAIRLLWWDGTYTDYTDFSVDTRAAGV